MKEFECRIKSCSLGDQNFNVIAYNLREATIMASSRVINGRLDYVREIGEVDTSIPPLEDKAVKQVVKRRRNRKPLSKRAE